LRRKGLNNVVMVAYTIYPSDARVRREAETMASLEKSAVTVIVLKEHPEPRCYMLDGVEIIELNLRKYRGKHQYKYFLSYFNYFFQAWLKITWRFIQRRLDVVHVHNMPNFLVMAAIIPKLFGKFVILDIHDSMPETYAAKFEGKPNHILLKLLLWEELISIKLADHIICVNHIQKQAIESHGRLPGPVSVVLNVPDPKRFAADKRNLSGRSPSERFNVVYHGTITKRLGIDLALQAINRLKTTIAGLQFFIFGTGDDLDEFIALRNSLGLEAAVHFNNKMLPVDKLVGKLTIMDLGLIANRKNIATDLMLPVKMLEYFALGIPVVAPRLKTIAHYCDEGMVSFYEPERIDSMVQAIDALYADPVRRCRQVERAKRFLDQYGWNRHKSELVAVYQF